MNVGLKKYLIIAVILFLSALSLLEGALSADDAYKQHIYRARVLFNKGEYESCLIEYKKAEEILPYAKEAIFNLALVYKNQAKYPQAVKQFEKLLEIEPNRVIYMNLGQVYYLNARPAQAVKAFETVLSLGQDDGLVYFWLGKCYEDLGSYKLAQANYKQAIAKDNNLTQAHLALGRLYEQKKNWSLAAAEFEEVKKLDPSLTELYPALGCAYYKLAKYEQSMSAFEKMRSIDPENILARQYIDKIYKVAGEKFKKKIVDQEEKRRQLAYARVVQPIRAEKAPGLRIFIDQSKFFWFKTGADFVVTAGASGKDKFFGKKNKLYKIINEQSKLVLLNEDNKTSIFEGKIKIVLTEPQATTLIFNVGFGKGQYWASKIDRSYRGDLEIMPVDNSELKIINEVNLEEYLYGVLPSEMPSDWSKEALKAQAIAARSEAYAKLGRHDKKEGFDFCSTVHCQVYGGAGVETEKTNSAVDETCGVVAVYKGKPIDALYSNSCGGHTQDNIFGRGENIPYLTGRLDTAEDIGFYFPLSPLELEDWLWGRHVDVLCNNIAFSRFSNFRWVRCYSRAELEALIKKELDIGNLISIKILERDTSAHIKDIEIIGTKGHFRVKKELNVRKILGDLRSSMFNVDKKLDRDGKVCEFLFYGGGWGHGVGMCQVGAASLSMEGYTGEDIIKFYYQDVNMEKMY